MAKSKSPVLLDTQSKLQPQALRWAVRLILVVTCLLQLVRILQVQASTGEVPFLSANDRSRWCTIAALAVDGSYEIDDVLEIRDPNTGRRTWYTIDLVRHQGADGKQHYYSSKPPLLPTMYAGVYIAIRAVTGATLMNNPFFIARVMLILVNLCPLIAFWWLLTRWMRLEKLDSWATLVLTLVLVAGTFLSTFVTTLNNHLPAAIAAGVSLWCIDRISIRKNLSWRWFVLCGASTSFAAANELPALSWVAMAGLLLAMADIRKTLLAYAPALLPVAIAFFGCNYLAHGQLTPAYAHRSVGAKMYEVSVVADADGLPMLDELVIAMRLQGQTCADDCIIRPARRAGVLELWDEQNQTRFGLKVTKPDGHDTCIVSVHQWGDWYDYPGSYWMDGRKQGVDKGEPSRAMYTFHCLLGHHGVFSLTPFWFTSILGLVIIVRNRETTQRISPQALMACAIAVTSIVVIGFYLSRGLEDRNYGGVSSGLRWTFWLIPFWFWLSMQAIKLVQSAWLRRLIELSVAISIYSANYPWRNPWTSPWLMQSWERLFG